MKVKKIITNLFIYALTIISCAVAVGLATQQNMWRWILAYWIVLFSKNAVDGLFTIEDKND